MRALIDELFNEDIRDNIIRKKLGFPDGVTLDISKLIIAGHSFGGMTAIETSMLEPSRIKACITMDPWLYCSHQ